MSQKKTEYSIDSVNPLYLIIKELEGYVEEYNGSKYLTITLTRNNNQVLIDYAKVWNGILEQIKKVNDGLVNEWGKDYMKTKFDSNDNIPLNKTLKFRALTIVIRSVFDSEGKYYPQTFLDNTLVDLQMIKVNLNNKKYNFIDKNNVDLFSVSYGSIKLIEKNLWELIFIILIMFI